MSNFKVYEPGYPYFITCSVVEWLPVFIERSYFEILLNSLKYCRQNKGLRVHGYVIMPTHWHAIISSANELVPIIRDIKSYTARELKKELEKNHNELFMWAIRRSAECRTEKGEQSFWQDGFHPEMVYSEEFYRQKLEYIHSNPVRKGLVAAAEHWQYSSAAAYAGSKNVPLLIDNLEI